MPERYLTVTQTFSGRPLKLEVPRIRSVDDLVAGPDALGIARREGVPDRDFPVAWIVYDAPATETTPAGPVNFYALQSGGQVRQALAEGVADLHSSPIVRDAVRDYLQAVQKAGHQTVCVYTPFGTEEARRGTWLTGPVEDRPIVELIANLTAGRPMTVNGGETLNDLRQLRAERKLALGPELK